MGRAVRRGARAAIVADAEAALDGSGWPVHPREAGDDLFSERPTTLYLGAAGMLWALRSLGTSLDVAPLAADVLRRYAEQPDFGADDPDLHFGEIGVLLVAHLVGVPGWRIASGRASAGTSATRRGS